MVKKRAQKLHECKNPEDCIYKRADRKTPACTRPSSCSDWGREID